MALLTNLRLTYQLILQTINGENKILSTIEKIPSIDLPNSITGQAVHFIQDGAIDEPLPIIEGFTDFVLIFAEDQEVSVKLNSPASVPIFIRVGGCFMADSKNITDVLITNASGKDARVLFVQARNQAVT